MKHTINPKLTARQQAFVNEYVLDKNRTQAAIRAGYSTRSAKQMGSRLMSKVDVQKAVDAALAKVAERHEIKLDRIVTMLLSDREFAIERKQAGAAIAATMGLARVTGHLVEDRRNTKTPLAEFKTEQLEQLEAMLADTAGDATRTH